MYKQENVNVNNDYIVILKSSIRQIDKNINFTSVKKSGQIRPHSKQLKLGYIR